LLLLSESSGGKMEMQYKHYANSVGNNLKTIQITTKYRYKMMKQEKMKVFCKVAVEEACKKHKIEISIIKVLEEHVHLIVDCPRTMCDAKMMQLIKGLSSYLVFRICPELRLRYPRGSFWNRGYFCQGCGTDFQRALSYIENQEAHHSH
jgi:putative transposase